MKSIHHSDSGTTDAENHLFSHGFKKIKFKHFSRNMSVFKDLPGLKNLEKKIQGLSRIRKGHVNYQLLQGYNNSESVFFCKLTLTNFKRPNTSVVVNATVPTDVVIIFNKCIEKNHQKYQFHQRCQCPGTQWWKTTRRSQHLMACSHCPQQL